MTPTTEVISFQLIDAAARALALACGAGLALTAFRVRATTLRLFTWTGILYAALAMPLLAWILPPLSFPLPTLFESSAAQLMHGSQEAQPAVVAPEASATGTTPAVNEHRAKRNSSASVARQIVVYSAPTAHDSPSPKTSAGLAIHWKALAITIYLSVALFFLIRMLTGFIFTRRLLRTSQRIHDFRVLQGLAARARACEIRPVPQVAESTFISVPVTAGVFRSAILFPSDWSEWDDAKLEAILAHELSHVARRDPLTQFVSLLHRAIFWFSPLAWWLDRQLADLAEQASDEAALSCGADRNHYARTLLGFFEALHATPGRVWWQGVSMAKAGQAEKRLERILAWRGAVAMNLRKSIVIAIITLAVPVVYLAASVRPMNSGLNLQRADSRTTDSQTAGAAQSPAPTPAPAAAPTVTPDPAAAAPVAPRSYRSMAPAVAPALPMLPRNSFVPMAPVAALAPVAPMAYGQGRSYGSGRSSGSSRGYSYSYGDDDDQRFVIVTGNSDSLTMSGSGEDARHVERLKKQISGDFIWFSRDEKSYVIRDAATIDRARKLWAPQEELGKKQEELGKQQEALGEQQEALGEQMEKVQVKIPDMTAELDALKAKLQKLGSSATMEQIGDLQEEIGNLQSKIGDFQAQAGEQQGKLGEQQGALGEKQGKLGEQQGKLGEEQGRLAEKASREMKVLLDEAIKNGKALPEPESGGAGTL